jgi:hypothetical protein
LIWIKRADLVSWVRLVYDKNLSDVNNTILSQVSFARRKKLNVPRKISQPTGFSYLANHNGVEGMQVLLADLYQAVAHGEHQRL